MSFLGVLLLVPVGPVVGEGEPAGVREFPPGPVQGEVPDTLVGQEAHVHLQEIALCVMSFKAVHLLFTRSFIRPFSCKTENTCSKGQ